MLGGVGIIPAYAGSTAPLDWQMRERRDHPRIRGEHSNARESTTWPKGSSPQTRGAQQPDLLGRAQAGIIPAYAGSTLKYLVII